MKLINRTSYMDTLTSLIGVPDIKVITGIRRSGKSKLLEALRDYVEANLSIRMSSISTTTSMSSNLLEYHALLAYVKSIECPANKTFCLSMKFRCATVLSVRSNLHASEQYDIFITGSNAFCCRAICRRSLRGVRLRSSFPILV
ncbi:MAG: AAA family ATPase [Collinsella sp.]